MPRPKTVDEIREALALLDRARQNAESEDAGEELTVWFRSCAPAVDALRWAIGEPSAFGGSMAEMRRLLEAIDERKG